MDIPDIADDWTTADTNLNAGGTDALETFGQLAQAIASRYGRSSDAHKMFAGLHRQCERLLPQLKACNRQ